MYMHIPIIKKEFNILADRVACTNCKHCYDFSYKPTFCNMFKFIVNDNEQENMSRAAECRIWFPKSFQETDVLSDNWTTINNIELKLTTSEDKLVCSRCKKNINNVEQYIEERIPDENKVFHYHRECYKNKEN